MFTEHFRAAELACRCGCGMLPERDFMARVERVRVRCGFPLIVSSAARCKARNAAVSKTGDDGPHTTGRAIDLEVMGNRAFDVVHYAILEGFTGIGAKQHGAGRLIHLDDLPAAEGRPRPWIWTYP